MESKEAKALSISYKRKGHFDQKRDEILKQFEGSEANKQLLSTIQRIVNGIIEKNPELLLRNRGQLAALIEGALSRQTKNSAIEGLNNKNKDVDFGELENVFDLFDQEVKDATIGSEELKREIGEVLDTLRP